MSNYYRFNDPDGNPIEDEKYLKYLIQGKCLEPGNIGDGNLVLCSPISFYQFKKAKTAKYYIFQNDNQSHVAYCYDRINIFNKSISELIDECLRSEQFDMFRKSSFFVSDEYIRKNVVQEKIDNCKWVALILQLNNENNYIFKIINAETVVAKVEYCFIIN